MKKIGLFGLGNVGQGFVQILNQDPLLKQSLKKIVVKTKGKNRPLKGLSISFSPEDILNDPEIGIVIDATDANREAFNFASATLSKGKVFISANKKMLAENLEDLLTAEKKGGGKLLFESAAAGAIPLLQSIDGYFKNDRLTSFEAVLNGSCNYILTQMEAHNWSFERALENAKKLGFAESNPSSDIEGWDTAYKLILVYYLFTGEVVKTKDLSITGIENIRIEDIEQAKTNGLRYKLIGHFTTTSKTSLSVEPKLVDSTNALYHVESEFNAARLDLQFAGVQFLLGKGAGPLPTGFAVYNDVLRALNFLKRPASNSYSEKAEWAAIH